jgi:hypothetical protein
MTRISSEGGAVLNANGSKWTIDLTAYEGAMVKCKR